MTEGAREPFGFVPARKPATESEILVAASTLDQFKQQLKAALAQRSGSGSDRNEYDASMLQQIIDEAGDMEQLMRSLGVPSDIKIFLPDSEKEPGKEKKPLGFVKL